MFGRVLGVLVARWMSKDYVMGSWYGMNEGPDMLTEGDAFKERSRTSSACGSSVIQGRRVVRDPGMRSFGLRVELWGYLVISGGSME